jgi:hypothetical protein
MAKQSTRIHPGESEARFGGRGRLAAGDQPAKGTIVYLRRRGPVSAAPQTVEWFEADGEWVCPRTVNGYYYSTADA